MTQRSLTGVKATGDLHLGRILGSVLPAISMQNTYECFYFIANYHSLSSITDGELIKENTYKVAAAWLALGLDPEKAIFYRQSDIPEITELCWLISSSISLGDLFRAHAFKSAKDENKEGALNLCTFSYPVLMAADIMAFDADIVPVGKDQLQHLEMARAIARRFNNFFGEGCLKEPKDKIQEDVAIVPGIDGQKMSASYNNIISPLASKKELKKQVMNIVTDSKGLEDIKNPDTCNIVTLYKLLASSEEIKTIEKNYRQGNYGYGHAKIALLEKLEEKFAPSREKYFELVNDKKTIDEILENGAKKARAHSRKILTRVRQATGFNN